MNKVLDIYTNLPFGMKNALKHCYGLIPLRYRLGKGFFKQLAFLEKSQWWPEAELENYQNEELKKLIRHAYENVPYYNNLFRNLKLTPKDIQTVHDLSKLPILTKDDVRNNLHLLKARNFNDNETVKLSTSGTTGKPLIFYYDRDKEYLNFDPFVWRFLGWAGHKIGETRAAFSRWLTSPNKVYSYNPTRNILGLSTYQMSLNNIEEYLKAIKKFRIKFIDGYPSAISTFTSFLEEKNIDMPVKLKAIFSHSEIIHGYQRRKIENYWKCKCFDWYGMEERVIMGTECPKHSGLHLSSEYGIAEFSCDKSGFKKIIATSLTNYAMPFIRYDTQDLGEQVFKGCECGRQLPVFILNGGRDKTFAIAKDGSAIPVTSLEIAGATDKIKQFQFIQNKKGELVLSIIKKNGFGETDLKKINALLRARFNQNMQVNIQFVETIYQTSSQKTPMLVQNVNESTR